MSNLTIKDITWILIIIGFLLIYFSPLATTAIILGMFLISISIISFAMLIYFPPPQAGYVKLKVIEEAPKASLKPKTRKKPKKRAKRSKRR